MRLRAQDARSERGLIVEVAARTSGRGDGGRRGPRVVEGATLAATTTETTGAGTGHLLHLRRGVAQGWPDLVNLELDDGALLALAGLVRPLTQPARHDHAGAPLQRLGDVLGRLPPDRAVEEERLAVLPLAGGPIEIPGRRSDAEPRHRHP